MDETKSGASSVRLSSGVSKPILMLNLRRPTRLKSYLRGSKNMPRKRLVAVLGGGGWPGGSLREILMRASFAERKAAFFRGGGSTTALSSRSREEAGASWRAGL